MTVAEMCEEPGPWLRLTAFGAVVATGLVVATGEWRLPHAATALAALGLVAATALGVALAHAERRALVAASIAAIALLSVEVALGGVVALVGDVAGVTSLHIAFGGPSFAACALVLTFASRLPIGRLRPLSWRDYLTLTKPRIMALLLLTATAAMFAGAGGAPRAGLLAATLAGLALACAGASALNHVLDRDIDRRMRRTHERPVASGRVAPERALEFGLALSAFSFVVLVSFVNVLAAVLAAFGSVFYVVVYTRWLKRATPQNIVIGGAAGAVPPLVGWAAATGDLALPALSLFLIVFLWTPPHFWALALLVKRDYQAAEIPMLPVVRGDSETARQILLYTLVLVPVTLLPVAWGTLGSLYLVAALGLGACFIALAWRLQHQTVPARARGLFHFSLAYLALLFMAAAVDPILI
jgi:heme o synthase